MLGRLLDHVHRLLHQKLRQPQCTVIGQRQHSHSRIHKLFCHQLGQQELAGGAAEQDETLAREGVVGGQIQLPEEAVFRHRKGFRWFIIMEIPHFL